MIDISSQSGQAGNSARSWKGCIGPLPPTRTWARGSSIFKKRAISVNILRAKLSPAKVQQLTHGVPQTRNRSSSRTCLSRKAVSEGVPNLEQLRGSPARNPARNCRCPASRASTTTTLLTSPYSKGPWAKPVHILANPGAHLASHVELSGRTNSMVGGVASKYICRVGCLGYFKPLSPNAARIHNSSCVQS